MIPKLKPEELLAEPVRPELWECCGSDCGDACIQTIYWDEKSKYDEQQRQWQIQQTEEDVDD